MDNQMMSGMRSRLAFALFVLLIGAGRANAAEILPIAPCEVGSWSVQVAESFLEQDVLASLNRIRSRYQELFGYKPCIKENAVGGRLFYRVRIGGGGRDEATALCSRLRANGDSCAVTRN